MDMKAQICRSLRAVVFSLYFEATYILTHNPEHTTCAQLYN